MHDLRRLLYHHIHRLSLAEHDATRTGDLISRVTSDIQTIQDFVTSALLDILTSVLVLAGIVGVMLYLNWRFTLISLSIAPLLFLVVYLLYEADQEGLAGRAEEGRRAALHRAGSLFVDPGGESVRPRRVRGAPVRAAESRQRGDHPGGAQASR